jgi:hypothetical protein
MTYLAEIAQAFEAAQQQPPKCAAAIGSPEWRRYHWNQKALTQAVMEKKWLAIAAFAEINGWEPTEHDFAPEQIGHRNSHWRSLDHQVFDHCLFFRTKEGAKSKNAAIITQPYNADAQGAAQHIAQELGLALHIPPNPQASIYWPGVTFFLAFTAPDIQIRWLPEMLS